MPSSAIMMMMDLQMEGEPVAGVPKTYTLKSYTK